MTPEVTHPGFYILTALSAVAVTVFVASLWFS